MGRQYVKAADIEPGTTLCGKKVSGWHVSDTSYNWYEFGCRCEYVSVEMTDGTTLPCVLIQDK